MTKKNSYRYQAFRSRRLAMTCLPLDLEMGILPLKFSEVRKYPEESPPSLKGMPRLII